MIIIIIIIIVNAKWVLAGLEILCLVLHVASLSQSSQRVSEMSAIVNLIL